MKALKTLFVAAFALTGLAASAQSADEIIARHIEANGGMAKIASLNSVKMTGSISVQGMDIPLTITKLHNKGYRLDLEIMGAANYQLANEKEGWVFMPIQGMSEPKQMEEQQYDATRAQLDLQGPLVNYKEKGKTVEAAGSEKVNGADAFKLKVTNSKGDVTYYFIDAKSYQLVKTMGKISVNGQDMDIETSFADFKQTADGFWFPYSVTSMNGTVTFDKIEVNPTVDESIFKN
ncbi:MAG: hypothetical protein WAT19_08280 [Ferruginibacter sp.]